MASVVSEFVGTFVLLSVGLRTQNPIIIATTLTAILTVSRSLTLNPAISLMLFAKGILSSAMFIGCVIAQFSAGIVALLVYNAAGV